MRKLISALQRRVQRWVRRKYGLDTEPFTVPNRRIYILPTGLGIAFAFMLLAMFIGAMNYASNLALGLAFMLSALALTAMHYCHRNLAGVQVRSQGCDFVFAGEPVRFRVAIENSAPLARHEIAVQPDARESPPQRIEPNRTAVFEIERATERRGTLVLDHFQISTRYPFGLFRAWTHIHIPMRAIVYPRPSERKLTPPPTRTDTGAAQELASGDEDFAGLRSFQAGDSPRRIAWKAYARGLTLQVKQYAGTAVSSYLFEWDALDGLPVEARLSQLCRWIEDAHAAGRAFGLRLPTQEIPTNIGLAHRHRCLTALALFDVSG